MTSLKRVDLHPATIKHLKAGHFWVTSDSFTNRFPKDDLLLIGVDSKTKAPCGIFFNDPTHRHVKARLISTELSINLDELVKMRIQQAISMRAKNNLLLERENFILINGENDLLPGLSVLVLKNYILIQYYAFYWKKLETNVLSEIKNAIATFFPVLEVKDIFIQERTFDQQKSIRSVFNTSNPEFILKEFEINYLIRINAYYDYGIYTDMSAIRKQLLPYLNGRERALNLFCYTGAYSLFFLKHGINEVHSVDLSNKYLDWLEENLKLNPELKGQHHSVNLSVEKALEKYIQENTKFDFILTDPPSSSSDGDKKDNAFVAYEKLLPKMLQILSANGSLICFLNTHQISWNKFEDKLKSIIAESEFKDRVIIGKRFKLSEDYLPVKGFYEGDYLKGFLIEFKNKGTK